MSIVHLGSESDYYTIVIATSGHSILFFFGKTLRECQQNKTQLVLGYKLKCFSGDKKMTKQSKYIRLHAVSLSQPEPSLSLSGSEEATYSGPKIPTFIISFPISETHFFSFLCLFGITNNWRFYLIFFYNLFLGKCVNCPYFLI